MTIRKIVLRTPVWLLLLVTAALMLFPIVIAIFGSLKTNLELTTGATFLPSSWQFKNYLQAWNQADFSAYTFNSLYVAVFVTVGTLLVSSMAAYAVDRVAFRGKKLFILLQSFTLFISIGAVVLRPQFDLMVSIGLQKSMWGVIIILISAHATAFLWSSAFSAAFRESWMKRRSLMAVISTPPSGSLFYRSCARRWLSYRYSHSVMHGMNIYCRSSFHFRVLIYKPCPWDLRTCATGGSRS